MTHFLTWSHYFELLKCDDPLEMQYTYPNSDELQSQLDILLDKSK